MKNQLEFDYLKFKNLLERTFGSQSVTYFAKSIDVSRGIVSGWINGKRRTGPSARCWDKIINVFSVKGVHIRPMDFMIKAYDMETPIHTFDEQPIEYGDPKSNLQIISDQGERLAKLTAKVDKLRNENKLLKKRIKELEAEKRN